MSEFGSIYSVDEVASDLLSKVSSKRDWYEVMGGLELETIPNLSGEQSISAWERTFVRFGNPLAKFYTGDLSTEKDDYGDPRVVFLNAASVDAIHQEMVAKGRACFEKMLAEHEYAHHIWLYDPLVGFFEKTTHINHGALVLCGH